MSEQGYTVPTPIQAQAIPVVLAGKDLLAAAQTGTGKTAGFTLPLLEILNKKGAGRTVRCLILVPTRRSVRALREAFLRAADGKPTILPRMAPLGDLDESEFEALSGDTTALTLPPAIDPAEREAFQWQIARPEGLESSGDLRYAAPATLRSGFD